MYLPFFLHLSLPCYFILFIHSFIYLFISVRIKRMSVVFTGTGEHSFGLISDGAHGFLHLTSFPLSVSSPSLLGLPLTQSTTSWPQWLMSSSPRIFSLSVPSAMPHGRSTHSLWPHSPLLTTFPSQQFFLHLTLNTVSFYDSRGADIIFLGKLWVCVKLCWSSKMPAFLCYAKNKPWQNNDLHISCIRSFLLPYFPCPKFF